MNICHLHTGRDDIQSQVLPCLKMCSSEVSGTLSQGYNVVRFGIVMLLFVSHACSLYTKMACVLCVMMASARRRMYMCLQDGYSFLHCQVWPESAMSQGFMVSATLDEESTLFRHQVGICRGFTCFANTSSTPAYQNP